MALDCKPGEYVGEVGNHLQVMKTQVVQRNNTMREEFESCKWKEGIIEERKIKQIQNKKDIITERILIKLVQMLN